MIEKLFYTLVTTFHKFEITLNYSYNCKNNKVIYFFTQYVTRLQLYYIEETVGIKEMNA